MPPAMQRRAKLPGGWMGKSSRQWLAEQAAGARHVIEVGCWLGRSTQVLARAVRGVVWAVDHWQGTPSDPAQHRLYAMLLAKGSIYRQFKRNLRRELKAGKVKGLRMTD